MDATERLGKRLMPVGDMDAVAHRPAAWDCKRLASPAVLMLGLAAVRPDRSKGRNEV